MAGNRIARIQNNTNQLFNVNELDSDHDSHDLRSSSLSNKYQQHFSSLSNHLLCRHNRTFTTMSSDSEDFSDEDYNPDKEVSEAGSEIESDDDVGEDDEPEASSASLAKKRKSEQTKTTRNKRVKAVEEDESHSPEKINGGAAAVEEDEDSEKKRADALWADFLGGDAPADEPKEEKPRAQTKKVELVKKPAPPSVPEKKKEPVVIKEIFEYAGEQVVVEKVVVQESEPQTGSSKSAFPTAKPSGSSGGLGSILGALNKKNKISTLDKTKLDWDRFKNQEGITEDLNTFNKGKDGYLERQDFLQRTDVRQFELERTMRQTTRSNR